MNQYCKKTSSGGYDHCRGADTAIFLVCKANIFIDLDPGGPVYAFINTEKSI